MRNITTIWLLFAALMSGACQSDTTSNHFTVHSEIMGVCDADDAPAAPVIKPASNITIGAQSVYAFYADAEFILQYGGKVFIERGGKQGEPIPAKVFQLEPGVWVAEIEGGQYIKVFAESGNTNIDLDGEFQTYRKN
ncbi:MAG TPA: hypothetical protein PK228_20260 [Saprospiraceae bacterium]|nr:hypothetical protein [Saprospiraceae bacterium]